MTAKDIGMFPLNFNDVEIASNQKKSHCNLVIIKH